MNDYVEDIIRQADEEQFDGMNGYGLAMDRIRERRERRALWSAIGFAAVFSALIYGLSWLFLSKTGQAILDSIFNF